MKSDIDVVFICKDRILLTIQALITMHMNTDMAFNLTIVDDASEPENLALLAQLCDFYDANLVIKNESQFAPACRIEGATYGDGKYLYFSDNDVVFQPHWLETLVDSWTIDKPEDIKLLGGGCHAYMKDNKVVGKYHYKDAIPTWSWFMERETWTKYLEGMGSTTPTGQSEDWMFCQRIVKDGGSVASLLPEVVLHTGVTQWNQETKTAGYETLEVPKGVLML